MKEERGRPKDQQYKENARDEFLINQIITQKKTNRKRAELS